MAKSFPFEIVTPERLFYFGDVELVIVRTTTGEEGFMAGHSWACKLLGTGELWFREAGSKEYRLAAISEGFIDVREEVLIYTDSAEWQGEIDLERAKEAGRRELEWLEHHKTGNASAEEVEAHKLKAKRADIRQKVAAGGTRQRH